MTTSFFQANVVGLLLNNAGVKSTTTALSSSLNPSISGQKVTWTATVTTSGSITPTGKVRFVWSIYPIGSATLNSSGVATLTKSNLNADPYPLTAVYGGDANNLPSTSAILNQVVLQTTSTASLTSSPNPSMLGQAVTFTATISSPTVNTNGTSYLHGWKDGTGYSATQRRQSKTDDLVPVRLARPRSRRPTTEIRTSPRV